MKLLACEAFNFGSYKHLEIDFSQSGLTLISGPTGAGKSTLPDLACWALYGQTAKGGSVDEVRSWFSPNEITKVIQQVELNDTATITITRIRGKGGQNDLYWTEDHYQAKEQRGKDITETQRNLERRLGVSAQVYLTGCYFSEFSDTGSFFLAKSKDRRAVLETVADLQFATRVATKVTEHKKISKKTLEELQIALLKSGGRIEQLKKSIEEANESRESFDKEMGESIQEILCKSTNFTSQKESRIQALQTRSDQFETDKNRRIEETCDALERIEASLSSIEALEVKLEKAKSTTICDKCGQPNKNHQDIVDKIKEQQYKNKMNEEKFSAGKKLLGRISEEENPYIEQIEAAKTLENHYAAQLEEEKKKINPFIAQLEKLNKELNDKEFVFELDKMKIDSLSRKVGGLTKLYDLSLELRAVLLKKSVKSIEDETNRYLERYFDSEIRVRFEIEGADNLEVFIQKNVYPCVYRQLSKGQRGLLKLCFVVSVMRAASNRAGVHFSNLFLDESLDGLDTDLKVKAFSLLQELAKDHESVYVIDHCEEFKSLFDNRYLVSLEADVSRIEQQDE